MLKRRKLSFHQNSLHPPFFKKKKILGGYDGIISLSRSLTLSESIAIN